VDRPDPAFGFDRAGGVASAFGGFLAGEGGQVGGDGGQKLVKVVFVQVAGITPAEINQGGSGEMALFDRQENLIERAVPESETRPDTAEGAPGGGGPLETKRFGRRLQIGNRSGPKMLGLQNDIDR